MENIFSKVTAGVKVTVEPVYLEHQSSPNEGEYTWAYNVRVENKQTQAVQLLNRHWKITDGNGKVEEVQGAGVVGEQPTIGAGEAYEYTSGTVLNTTNGIMAGTYQMVDEEGGVFDIEIPAFSLDVPGAPITVN